MPEPQVEVNLTVGQEITLTSPKGGTSIVQNVHSSDAAVLTPRPTSSALAQFRAVSPGAADVIGQSRFCMYGQGADATCTVAHVIVNR